MEIIFSPYVIIPVVVVLILLMIILFKKLLAESPGNQWQESFNALAKELNASVKRTTMTGTFEGFSFECNRVPFWIQLQFPLALELSIKKAGWIEKLWKKFGLVLSINTGDSNFNSTFAVRTNSREIAQKILHNDNYREPIKKLLTLFPAREILIAGKKISAKFKSPGGFSIKAVEAIAKNQAKMIKESLQHLSQLSHQATVSEGLALKSELKIPGQGFFRLINLTILALVIIGFLLISVGLAKYEPLELLFWSMVKVILPYVCLFTAVTLLTRYLNSKKGNYLRLEVLDGLISSILLYVLSGMGYYIFTNGYLDRSPEIRQTVSITGKKIVGKGERSDYFIYFQFNTKNNKKIDIEVEETFYKAVKTGDSVTITYKRGYHHVPWLVSYDKGNP